MNKIHVLSQEVIQKIAAGEIVERPSHIIKELLENALDAGSTQVSIEIEDGGKESIIVQDNGHGMSSDDALLATKHHTTSKLRNVQDLETLSTYGFRGEALSSIASVSNFSLLTREKEHVSGYEVTISGGNITKQEIAPSPVGTRICVRDLFFNTPARKKFLKKESTELNQIKQLFFASCFQALSVHFSLKSDTRILYSCPGVQNVGERFIQLEGIDAHTHMIPLIGHDETSFSVSGLISDTQYVSYDRSDIFIFVNNRWIKNSPLIRALINGYQNSLPAQKYPRAILHIKINPQEVDINIHPKKEEVRFLHPRRVETAITDAVKKTLESRIPHVHISQGQQFADNSSFQQGKNQAAQHTFINTLHTTHLEKSKSLTPPHKKGSEYTHFISSPIETINVYQPSLEQQFQVPMYAPEQQQEIKIQELHCIGQLFSTYILASDHNRLYIIDQHAAHERIMFEQCISQHQGLLSITQAFPLLIPLSSIDIDLLNPHFSTFSLCGIICEQFDHTNIIVTATPAALKEHDLTALCKELIIILKDDVALSPKMIEEKLLHHIRCHIACKSAVKAGNLLDMISMTKLITDLSHVENRFCCPHGRPTMWEISITELEKRFKRKN